MGLINELVNASDAIKISSYRYFHELVLFQTLLSSPFSSGLDHFHKDDWALPQDDTQSSPLTIRSLWMMR